MCQNKEKIKSKPLGLLLMLIPLLCITLFIERIFLFTTICHFYEKNMKVLILNSIFHIPLFLMILGLWVLIWGRVEIDENGLKWRFWGIQHEVCWEEIKHCYYEIGEWEESSWFYVLVIETDKGVIRLGPEWTNRDQLHKLIRLHLKEKGN